MNNSPVKSELYVALENGRINLLLTSYKILEKPTVMAISQVKDVAF